MESKRGQALVEFAIVAPILILIFAAVAQLGLIYERQIGIENAVRDAARRAATIETINVNPEADANGPWTVRLLTDIGGLLPSNVQDYSSSEIEPPLSVCYRTQLDATAIANSVLVKVSVTYRHPLFLPIITQLLDGLDGHIDNALWVSTSSEFQVQNTTPASVDKCYTYPP